ncbi:hypothetical protein NQ315_011240 [Exocentrus adspersus]|uniref:Carboxylesterase type B domain-containing protein n=1 Tax=Exocentrus adspersus TaxID=1586481 RepID=A0AAV8V9J8_9CUCU|nr:hypothetical protein NQ315_011240 [Exocentrus adspersus]
MSDAKDEKSEDKKNIEMEEREKMLNASNKVEDKLADIENAEEKKGVTKDIKEGMEVKPKKIPIGGIQMPGFFTRSKSKERCKTRGSHKDNSGLMSPTGCVLESMGLKYVFQEDGDTTEQEGTDLIDKNAEHKDETNNSLTRIKLPNPFRKSKIEEEGALLIFLVLIAIIIFIAIPGNKVNRSPPIKNGRFIETTTSCGKVEGLLEDSAFAFRGIPYARSPIGDLRFKYAQPLNKLEYCWNGTFLAHNATDPCLQILSNGTIMGSEDCLTLDVVTPYVRYDNPLPVIVLIGAESLIGGSPGKMRPSARYARSRDVVFVRPNFRLGILGFLALQTLSGSDYPNTSGNYGLSDILVALKWVQLNIEHFGGDPKSVTLWGHRAGATLVTALSTVYDAHKYFARAWASSGGALYPKKTLAESQLDNKSFLNAVQCQDEVCLRKMDARTLVSAVEDTWRKPQPDLPSPDEDPDKRHQWLVLDGRILREHPAEVWSRDENLTVKLVIGSTAHAGSSEKLLMKHKNWTEKLVIQHINESFLSEKNLTHEALKMYPATYKGLSAMISDIRIVCPLFAISTEMHNVPFYVVNQTRFEQDIADIDSDVDAILGRYEPKTPEQRRYFSAMQSLFYHYVWHGKIEQSMIGQKVLLVDQDVLPQASYSHCAYWIVKNVVLPYAALD